MSHIRIYKVITIGFVFVFGGYLTAVSFWPKPQAAEAYVSPTLNIQSGSLSTQADSLQSPDTKGLYSSVSVPSSDAEVRWQSVLDRILLDKSQSTAGPTGTSTASPPSMTTADHIASPSNADLIATTAPATSGNPATPASTGSGSSTTGGATANPAPTPTNPGGAGGTAKKHPDKLFYFAGQRTRMHFRVLEYPSELRPFFAPDFVWHVAHFRNEQEWQRMMRLLRQFNKNIIIGYYHSACTTLPPEKDYDQPSKMPNEHVPDKWILKHANGNPVTYGGTPDRFFLDMRKEDVRQAVISLAIARAKHYGYDAVSFDNCYYGYGVPASTAAVVSEKEWTEAFMKFYEEAGKATRENGLKCIVNFAARAGAIPIAFEAIAPFVDGIMTEMPFHENIVKAGRVQRELDAYEKVAKEGTMVLLMQTREGRGHETLKLARPLVDKYDNIYLSILDFNSHYLRHGRGEWHKDNAPPVSTWYRNP